MSAGISFNGHYGNVNNYNQRLKQQQNYSEPAFNNYFSNKINSQSNPGFVNTFKSLDKAAKAGPDPEVIIQSQNYLNKLNESQNTLRTEMASNMDPESVEAKQTAKKMEALNEVKVKVLDNLAGQYPPNSPDAKALRSSGELVKLQGQSEAINNYLEGLRNAKGAMLNQISNLNDPESNEALMMQKRVEALTEIERQLELKESENQKSLNRTNKRLQKQLKHCTPEIQQLIKNEVTQENKKADPQKVTAVGNYLNEVNNAMSQIQSQISALNDPESNEAKMMQKRLESLNTVKTKLLNNLAEDYSPTSPEGKSLRAAAKLSNWQLQLNSIENYQQALQNSIGALQYNSGRIGADSAEGQMMQKRIEALNQVNERLELQKKQIEQDNNRLSTDLSNNLDNCDPSIQQIIGSLQL